MTEYFNYEPLESKPASQILYEKLDINIPNPLQSIPNLEQEQDYVTTGLDLNNYFMNQPKEQEEKPKSNNTNFSHLH